jgi:hypothetical protein
MGRPENLVVRVRAIDDPFVACIFVLAELGEIELNVSAGPSLHCHLVDFDAMANPALLLEESLAQSRFVVASSLLLYQSLDVMLAGKPLLVDPKDLLLAVKRKPATEPELKATVTSVIAEAVRTGAKLTNSQLVAAVESRGVIAAKNQVLKCARQLKPDSWRRPGPK